MFFSPEPPPVPENLTAQIQSIESSIAQEAEINSAEPSSFEPTDNSLFVQTNPDQDVFVPVYKFKDVQPSDWAYQAIANLIEKYECLPQEVDDLYRGNQAITRNEFAVAVNSCLEVVEALVGETPDTLDSENLLNTLSRLATEFDTELAALRAKLDDTETDIFALEDNLFSTNTKLDGEAIFALTSAFGDNFTEGSSNLSFLPGVTINLDPALVQQFAQRNRNIPRVDALVDNDQETVFGYRVRLDLNTTFTGKDNLLIRLASTNLRPFTANSRGRFKAPAIPPFLPRPINARFVGNTGETFQTFNVNESKLIYSFPVGTAQFNLAATGAAWHDFVPTVNPYFFDSDGGSGAISTFASENPIYRIGGGTGIVMNLPVAWKNQADKNLDLTLGYLAGTDTSNPAIGIANASYGTLLQTTFGMGNVDWAFTYVHAYNRANDAIFNHGFNNRDGFVGTQLANLPGSTLQRLTQPLTGLPDTGVVTNSYGVGGSWKLGDRLSLSGFAAYTDLKVLGQGDGEMWTYGVGLALPDFGKRGNLLGIFAGAQPYLSVLDLPNVSYQNQTTPFHIEAFYRYQINDRMTITPGVVWLMAPNGFDSDVVITTLRTTFLL